MDNDTHKSDLKKSSPLEYVDELEGRFYNYDNDYDDYDYDDDDDMILRNLAHQSMWTNWRVGSASFLQTPPPSSATSTAYNSFTDTSTILKVPK